jgi:hypothetical protein
MPDLENFINVCEVTGTPGANEIDLVVPDHQLIDYSDSHLKVDRIEMPTGCYIVIGWKEVAWPNRVGIRLGRVPIKAA